MVNGGCTVIKLYLAGLPIVMETGIAVLMMICRAVVFVTLIQMAIHYGMERPAIFSVPYCLTIFVSIFELFPPWWSF